MEANGYGTRKGKVEEWNATEPLYQEATNYLQIGLNLPDDFFVRQEILWKLIEIEAENKNFPQALSYADELSTKYPTGKYGKQAPGGKKELLELQRRELTQAPQPRVSGWSRLLPLFLVITAGIVLIGLILVLKKKASSRGKSQFWFDGNCGFGLTD